MAKALFGRQLQQLAGIFISSTFLLVAQAAQAGPIFEIIGNGSSAPFALSGSWGISSTGSGGLIGSITLRDGFALPTTGFVDFTEADIVEVSYSHEATPFSDTTVIPVFSFTASQSALDSAFGQVVVTGPDSFRINSFNLNIETSVSGSVPVLFNGFGGLVQGDFFINGIAAGIHGLTDPIDFDVSLVPLSTAPGSWQFTGFTQQTDSVPEPGGLAVLAFGIAGLISMRRRRP